MGKYLDIVESVKAVPVTHQAGAEVEISAGDTVIDGDYVAVMIDSTLLGAPIWFALRDGWTPDAGDLTPVFYASELPALRQKTPEQLRDIFQVKRVFGGGVVRQ